MQNFDHRSVVSLSLAEREEFVSRYTDKEKYNPDEIQPTLFIFKDNDKQIKTLEKEIIMARRLAKLGYEIYLLPDTLTNSLAIVFDKKIPDAISSGFFIELKQSETGSRTSIKRQLREGKDQGDIVYIEIPGSPSQNFIRESLISQINNSKSDYDRKIVITYSKDLYCYTIKEGTLSKGVPCESSTLAKCQLELLL